MMLYEAYSNYVDEENKQSEEEQARYQETLESQRDQYNIDNFKNQMPKIPDMSNLGDITKGFTNNFKF